MNGTCPISHIMPRSFTSHWLQYTIFKRYVHYINITYIMVKFFCKHVSIIYLWIQRMKTHTIDKCTYFRQNRCQLVSTFRAALSRFLPTTYLLVNCRSKLKLCFGVLRNAWPISFFHRSFFTSSFAITTWIGSFCVLLGWLLPTTYRRLLWPSKSQIGLDLCEHHSAYFFQPPNVDCFVRYNRNLSAIIWRTAWPISSPN